MSDIGDDELVMDVGRYCGDDDDDISMESDNYLDDFLQSIEPVPSKEEDAARKRARSAARVEDRSSGRGNGDDAESEGGGGGRPSKASYFDDGEDAGSNRTSGESTKPELMDLSDDEFGDSEEEKTGIGGGEGEEGQGKDAADAKKDIAVAVSAGGKRRVTYTINGTTLFNNVRDANPSKMAQFLSKRFDCKGGDTLELTRVKRGNDDQSFKKCQLRITAVCSKRELHGHLQACLKFARLNRSVGVKHVRGRVYRFHIQEGCHEKDGGAEEEDRSVDYTVDFSTIGEHNPLLSEMEGLKECMAAKLGGTNANVSAAVGTTGVRIQCNTSIKKARIKRIVHNYLKKHQLLKHLKISAAKEDPKVYELHERADGE
ncbi:hypothetical protein ACHAXT_005522 [Thalassiosira profunda]